MIQVEDYIRKNNIKIPHTITVKYLDAILDIIFTILWVKTSLAITAT